MRTTGSILACLVIGLFAPGCSDDSSGQPEAGPTPDRGAADQAATPDGAASEIGPETGAQDTALADTGPRVDYGPDIMNPNSHWAEATEKPGQKLYAVAGRSATEVYAVGAKGLILKYNGSRWASQTNPDSGNNPLYTLWGDKTTTYMHAAGDSIVLYNTSGSWAKGGATYSYASAIRDIWGPTSGSYMTGCGEMGYYMTYRSSNSPTASWSSIYLYNVLNQSMFGIWGYGTTNRWVVGDAGTMVACIGNSTCTSTSYWTKVTTGTTTNMKDIYGFYSSSKLDIFIVGFDGLVMHYNGSKFTRLNVNTHSYFYGVWGTSPSDIWIVGHPYFNPDESVYHYDGKTFSKVPPPRTSYLNAVWGASSSEVFAVGNYNIISLKKRP
jgi:hypothetical protein